MTMPQLTDLVESEYAAKIMPSLVVVFSGLKRAYEEAQEEDDSDEDSEEEDSDDDGGNDLSDSEDDIDEDSAVYLESLEDKIKKHTNGNINVSIEDEEEVEDSDEDEEEYDYEVTRLTFITVCRWSFSPPAAEYTLAVICQF